jgi:tetratricopeptide (TPR) repeat protein
MGEQRKALSSLVRLLSYISLRIPWALAIQEQVLGWIHPHTAPVLNNLAMLYADQDEFEQAEPLLQFALAIREQLLGPDHSDTATSLTNLATLYIRQEKFEQAEPLLQRALPTGCATRRHFVVKCSNFMYL